MPTPAISVDAVRGGEALLHGCKFDERSDRTGHSSRVGFSPFANPPPFLTIDRRRAAYAGAGTVCFPWTGLDGGGPGSGCGGADQTVRCRKIAVVVEAEDSRLPSKAAGCRAASRSAWDQLPKVVGCSETSSPIRRQSPCRYDATARYDKDDLEDACRNLSGALEVRWRGMKISPSNKYSGR